MKKIVLTVLIIIFVISICSASRDPYSRFEGKHLHLINRDKELFWFSGIHNNDPGHRMFDDIEKEFSLFKPDFVLVEGNANLRNYKTKKDAILYGGEPGFVSFLAKKSGIQVESIEPTWEAQFEYLLNKYSGEDILAMYIIRQIVQKQRESENVELNIMDYLKNNYVPVFIRNGFPLDVSEVDLEYIRNILEPHLGFRINNSNWKDGKLRDVLYFSENVINKIYKDVASFRDKYAVNYINQLVKNNDKIRIFVMMGADHLETQEEQLRNIFDD